MHVCRLMQLDFTDGTGRHDERGQERFDAADLCAGAWYARDWLAEGETVCPLYGYDLAAFLRYCESSLLSLLAIA